MMRAQVAVPLGRGRFTELSLLIWVATIAITIPTPAMRLPRTAVRGPVRPMRP